MKRILFILAVFTSLTACDNTSKDKKDDKETPIVKVDTLKEAVEDNLIPTEEDLEQLAQARPGKPKKPVPQPTPTPIPTEPTPTPTPTGVACLYFDFDGETVISAAWNGGQRIVCEPAPFDEATRKQMLYRVQAAYEKYNVTVTDDVNVFNNAARSQRIIVTPTSAWYPNTSYSGVAKIGGLGSGAPAFVFTDRLHTHMKYVSDIMVHESGHTIGLYHQGEYSSTGVLLQTYKPGPWMGSPFSLDPAIWIYQQWSGQDDDKVLTAKLGLR